MTELIWDGKYVDGKRQSPTRVALPFQTIETVNESAADRRQNLELFTTGRETAGRNRLIWGDKKYVLPSLLPEFAGKVNLIYIDPPFDTGANFSFSATVPAHEDDEEEQDLITFTKQPSILEQKAYRDTWGRGLDSYLHWMSETLILLRELLAENGSIYVHLDYHVAHYVKAVLDEVFGEGNFRNEIIWKRKGGSANPQNRLGVVTDSLFWFSKSENVTFNPQFTKESDESKKYVAERFNRTDESGRRFMDSPLVSPNPRPNLKYTYKGYPPPPAGWSISKEIMEQWDKAGKLFFPSDKTKRIRRKIFLDEYVGQPIQNLWNDIFVINSQSKEFVGYETQKPEALLERILKASSDEGDLVLDCFCGSGIVGIVAERLGRRWVMCDLSRFSIHTTRKRLLSVPGVKPFIVQNLGKYERQAWQTSEFQTRGEGAMEQQRQRETAYRKFILDLYRANPVSGQSWLHGIKSGRMVHVGAVDAPVTLTDVKSIAREVWKTATGSGASRKAAADILGWEFAFELNETARQVAAESRVDVAFKKIPREVLEKKAVEQGDVKFFELGALFVEPKLKGRELVLTLTDFVIPIDDVPEEARKAIKHWSQMVDYWAVDWDFKDDTFHNQWRSYRTRRAPKIELSTKYEYDKPGSYRVLVKVIDILGNDTTKTLDIKVK